MDLDVTLNRIGDITLGDLGEDLFMYMKQFFDREDIQRRMVEMNQERLYFEHIGRTGQSRPRYTQYTLKKRKKADYYTDSTSRYHSYEEGDLFRSFGVETTYTGASVISDKEGRGIALGMDVIGADSKSYDSEHIVDFFEIYDPTESIMGLTDEELSTMKADMTEHILTELKNYLTYGHNS